MGCRTQPIASTVTELGRMGARQRSSGWVELSRSLQQSSEKVLPTVLGYPLKTDLKKRDVEAKAVPGLFIGHAPTSATTLLLTEEGVLRTRGLARMAVTEWWNYKLENFKRGTPWRRRRPTRRSLSLYCLHADSQWGESYFRTHSSLPGPDPRGAQGGG
eukprot:3581992-Amphidinium_carterae.1